LSRLTELYRIAKLILQTEGLIPLVRRGLSFVLWCFFQYGTYYLFEYATEDVRKLNEADFMPKIDNFTLKIVSSNQEADRLEAEGLEFRSQSVKNRNALDKGAIAFCIFVEQELAYMSWIAMTQEAKEAINEPPYAVNFSEGMACAASTWTRPKYRRMRLNLYGRFRDREFLFEKGIPVQRYSINKRNIASIAGTPKFSSKRYAEARYLKILWWKWWKEKPLPQPNGE